MIHQRLSLLDPENNLSFLNIMLTVTGLLIKGTQERLATDSSIHPPRLQLLVEMS